MSERERVCLPVEAASVCAGDGQVLSVLCIIVFHGGGCCCCVCVCESGREYVGGRRKEKARKTWCSPSPVLVLNESEGCVAEGLKVNMRKGMSEGLNV